MSGSPLLEDDTWSSLLAQCSLSTKLFASTFLPSIFTRKFSPLTDQIFEALDDPKIQKLVVAAPRGWGKTSVSNVAYPARNICYRQKKFIVPVSNTADKALMDAANLKTVLTVSDVKSGDIIPQVFGDLKTDNWSAKNFVAGDTFVFPRGAGQQFRGMNYNGYRPDLIVCDDLEDPEGVMSEVQRAKTKQWFFADLMNSVDRSSNNWKIVVIGTLLHEACLLSDLLKDGTWKRVVISLCSDDLKSNWPEFISDEKVEELFSSYLAQGQADTFAREYQNKPISGVDAVFKSDFFHYYNPSDILDDKNIYYVTICDPAKTTKLHSADSAVVTIGLDLEKHVIYFHDCVAGKFHPDELYENMFSQVLAHNSRILAVEVTSLNEFITQPIKNEMQKRGIFPQFVELKARDKKENRVAQLAPFYRQGYIQHNKAVSKKLEMQLTMFPRSELWDVMDAFAYVIELMELDERYFYCEEIPGEDEYASLEDDPTLDVGWRCL